MAQITQQARLVLNTFVPQRRKPHPRHATPDADKDLSGKTVVFVGGTDGMGRVAVQMLYAMGADVVLLGRTKSKGEAVVDDLSSSGRGTINFEICDLASMESVRACVDRILAAHPRIDVLVNCAGTNTQTRKLTDEGFEFNWAVNYLGPFLLTNLLLERLARSAPARIVNLSSETEALGHIHFDDLQLESGWSSVKSYAQAKLALIMFTMELARKLEGTDVTANVLNPGFIQSNLLRELKGVQGLFRWVMRVFASPPEVGADRIVRLAISSRYSGVSGKFVSEDDIEEPNPEALDEAIRDELIRISESALSRWMKAPPAERHDAARATKHTGV